MINSLLGPASVAVVLSLAALPVAAQNQIWLKQIGTSASESALSVTTDHAGGAYVCGITNGPLWGPYMGGGDAWLARFDPAGNPIWGKQIGTTGQQLDEATDVEPDSGGGVFVGGHTRSKLGAAIIGGIDAWVARYDPSGSPLWLTQFGSLDDDELQAVVARPDGGVYAAGRTTGEMDGPNAGAHDIWVARLDWVGQVMWKRQLGTFDDDEVWGATLDDAGGVYLCGRTRGDLASPSAGNFDAWVARFDEGGSLLWQRQIGLSSLDCWMDAYPDGAGGAYLVGEFFLSPTSGVIARVDGTGDFLWIKPLGSAGEPRPSQIAADGSGGLYVCGHTSSPYGGPIIGLIDAFVTRLDGAGNELWVQQLGTTTYDVALGIAADGAGGAIVAGYTWGSLGGPSAGPGDVWMARYDGSCGVGPNYCNPSISSIPGCQAQLSATGSPRISLPSEFTVSSGLVPGSNIGICFFGNNGSASSPFGTLGGQVCVQGPFFRSAPKPSGGSSGVCNGAYTFSLQDLINASPIVTSGAEIHAQVWARDPANQDGFLLSDGLRFTVCP